MSNWSYSELYQSGKPKKPVKLPPIFTGKQRQAAISKVMILLDDWRFSRFEKEAITVAGMRSALCLKGFPWPVADQEATSLVSEAFRALGATRPSWDEGQPEFLIAREDCKYCRRPLTAEQRAGLRRPVYCSVHCARAALVYRYHGLCKSDHHNAVKAYDLIYVNSLPERKCRKCGKAFRSKDKAVQYCSQDCASIGRRVVPDRKCLCCGTLFHPNDSWRHSKYCDQRCYEKHRASRPLVKTCVECGHDYHAKTSRSVYCCPAHQLRASRRRRAGEVHDDKRVSIKQCLECGRDFEAYLAWSLYCCPSHQRRHYKRKLAARTADNVIYLTIDIFDSWFAEAA